MARPDIPRFSLTWLEELKRRAHRQVGEAPRVFGPRPWTPKTIHDLRGGPPQPPIPGGRAQLIADAKFAKSRRGSQDGELEHQAGTRDQDPPQASKRSTPQDHGAVEIIEGPDGIRQYRRRARPPAK